MNPQDERTGATFPGPQSSQIQQQMISSVLLLILGYYAISYFDSWPSAAKRTVYEALIRIIPSHFVYGLQQFMMKAGYLKRQEAAFQRRHFSNRKKKEEALLRIFGHTALPSVLRKARSLSGFDRLLPTNVENGPPGLGNWDNSCYQNSVLQALASLPAFQQYLHRCLQFCQKCKVDGATTEALATFVDRLADLSCQKATIWTPAVLKSMDSWQQQDAQEYFSRIADAVEKESLQVTKVLAKRHSPDLAIAQSSSDPLRKRARLADSPSESAKAFRRLILSNPMEGMQAQALECQTCGFSEGISLTQFTCLTLSLGLTGDCPIEQLLNEYTEPELIEGVECDQCTKNYNNDSDPAGVQNGNQSLATQGNAETKQKKVLRTKAKQLTLGRLPRDLVLHINRSIFDEYGNQRKNSSFIQFSAVLNILGKWCPPLERDAESSSADVQASYQLKCIITHSGRHDNGHYVAYARRDKDWYCFNDEIVTKITEDEVLHRGNVFMLFYEMIDTLDMPLADTPDQVHESKMVLEAGSTPQGLLPTISPESSLSDDILTSATSPFSIEAAQSESTTKLEAPLLHVVES